MPAYADLEQRFRRLSLLRDATAMLQWDMMAMMPAGGAAARAEQLATLHLVCHEQLTDPRLSDLLDAAEAEPGLAPWQRANLAEMRRGWVHARRLTGPCSWWVVWADAEERDRLRRLYAYGRGCPGPHGSRYPKELRTPKPRKTRAS